MAGAGYKLFNTGDVLTAAQVNTYLMEQTIMVFANAAARDTALSGVVAQGMQCFLKDTNTMQYYSGSAWVTLSTGGDITSVTAGTGISGGGTSGDVTITNSMATTIDAKGDLIAGTANDTFARLAVGNNGETLVADSSTSTGLRWQGTQAAGKNYVINGGMDIWQRGTSVAIPANTSTYSVDRWTSYRTATGSTVSRQDTNDSTNLPNIQYCARVQRDSGNTSTAILYFATAIETVNSIPLAGQQVVLSFWARAGANYSAASSILSSNITTGTGTDQAPYAGYTGTATPTVANNTLTTTWQRFSQGAVISSTAKEMKVEFQFTPVGTAGANDYFEVTGVQLEIGFVRTAFSRAGGTLAGELAACQRYFQYWGNASTETPLGIGSYYSTTQCYGDFRLPVIMRTAPTLTYSSGTQQSVYVAGTTRATTATNTTIARVDALRLEFVTAADTAGRAANLSVNGGHSISISAEL